MAAKPTDLYMQWFGILGKTNATNSTTLREVKVGTGLSVRGEFMWLLHMITVQLRHVELNANRAAAWIMAIALSNRQGLTVLPRCQDAGHIASWVIEHDLHTQGGIARILPAEARENFLPPMPLASPNLSMYVQTAADVAAWRDKSVDLRIGFTTTPIDSKAYLEIAETWGYQQ